MYNHNKIIIFILKYLKKQNCKKICIKYHKNKFLFEINIQLKNNLWKQFSIICNPINNFTRNILMKLKNKLFFYHS